MYKTKENKIYPMRRPQNSYDSLCCYIQIYAMKYKNPLRPLSLLVTSFDVITSAKVCQEEKFICFLLTPNGKKILIMTKLISPINNRKYGSEEG